MDLIFHKTPRGTEFRDPVAHRVISREFGKSVFKAFKRRSLMAKMTKKPPVPKGNKLQTAGKSSKQRSGKSKTYVGCG